MRRQDLTTPRQSRRLGVHYDPDAFGKFSEGVARYLGTARFLVFQSFVIVAWIIWNLVIPERFQFDPWGRGLVLLTLVLSLQASYAAAPDPPRPEPAGGTRPDPTGIRPSAQRRARRPTPSSWLARSPACASPWEMW